MQTGCETLCTPVLVDDILKIFYRTGHVYRMVSAHPCLCGWTDLKVIANYIKNFKDELMFMKFSYFRQSAFLLKTAFSVSVLR
jgi:hypothetical protein